MARRRPLARGGRAIAAAQAPALRGSWELDMDPRRPAQIVRIILALVAALFGIASVIAGTRILAGADPGYTVFRPLLLFNTAMGVAYVVAALVVWRDVERGKQAAAAIFGLNCLVLGAIGYLYATGSAVAIESLRAMIFRTVVWLVLFLGLAWVSGRIGRTGPGDA
jgi:hypothetical protein